MVKISELKKVDDNIYYIVVENDLGNGAAIPVDQIVYNQFKYFLDKLTVNKNLETKDSENID